MLDLHASAYLPILSISKTICDLRPTDHGNMLEPMANSYRQPSCAQQLWAKRMPPLTHLSVRPKPSEHLCSPVVPFYPFFGFPYQKPNSRKKGTLIIKRLLGNLGINTSHCISLTESTLVASFSAEALRQFPPENTFSLRPKN